MVADNLGFGAIAQLFALDDTTALLVSASTPPSVYAITLHQQTTSVEGDGPVSELAHCIGR